MNIFKLAALFEKKYAGKHGYGLLDEAPGMDLLKWKVRGTKSDGEVISAMIYGKTAKEAIETFQMVYDQNEFVDFKVEPAKDILK